MFSCKGFGVLLLSAVCAGSACGAEDKVLEGEPLADGGGSKDGGGANGMSNGTNNGNGSATNGNANGGSDGGGGTSGGTPSDPECDMNGIWIGRQTTRSEALSAGQFANNYYYMELRQDGDDVVVTKHFDCGIDVRGSVTVKITPATTKAMMLHNVKTGRKGTLKRGAGDTCDFAMERYWNVRGLDEARFAPSPRNSTSTLAQVASATPMPTKENQDGAEDWDMDGKPGVAWQISLGNSVRHTAQRDWIEWFSDPEHSITKSADWSSDLLVRAKFDAEEVLFEASSGLVASLSTVDASAKHTLALRFLGRDKSDSRAKALIKADDFDTCLAIQAALPPQNGL